MLDVIIEKSDDTLWGRIEADDFMPVTAGKTEEEVLHNLTMLIADHKEHEGKDSLFWRNIDTDRLAFNVHYDLRAFFESFDFLNISSVAQMSGMNPSLLRQYVRGIKFASKDQTQKIENTIHRLAEKLKNVVLVSSTVK